MSLQSHIYIAIDLKSFYASVECVDRGLDPLTTNLVVADSSRTEKTICLAVSPSLKTYGISGRARLFEVVEQVKKANASRRRSAPGETFTASSCSFTELQSNPSLSIDYIVASPKMARYMELSTRIYNIYLRYIAPEDIHVYSVDEVFIDATGYLSMYKMTARELAMKLIRAVLAETGITATAGIGTNLYLCKIAMDIVAKRMDADENGVRIAELDELTYRRELWCHRPLTDFWRIGHGYMKRLSELGLYTMGDIARCSIGRKEDFYNEELLYKAFGINAELLIDHAWGYEPCTISDIKAYRPETNSISSGQVLTHPYDFAHARLIVREMTDLLVLELVEKGFVTDQMVLTVGYDVENLTDVNIRKLYHGEITTDHYGRQVPKSAHGSVSLPSLTSSTRQIMEAVTTLFDQIVNPNLTVRRMYVVANHIVPETEMVTANSTPVQLDLFTDYEALNQQEEAKAIELSREKSIQKAMLDIKKKFGKNAILKGMNLEEGATTIERNGQVGGHKA